MRCSSQIRRTFQVVLLVCLAAGGGFTQPAIDLSGLEALAKEAESATAMPERMEARCTKVLAGDRIDALVASGNTMKVLYLGVKLPDPESSDPAIRALYQKAFGWNKQLVENQLVTLEFERLEPDKGGRFAAYVFCGKTFVNAELVRQGLARVDEAEFQLKRFLEKKQALAREERLGIWALVPPAPPADPVLQSSGDQSRMDFEPFYVASQNSPVFHRPGCEWAKKIKEKNRIIINTRAEALASDRRPCKLCNP